MNGRCFKCTFSCLAEYGCDYGGRAWKPSPTKRGVLSKLKKKYRRWKFIRMWNKKNKNWRECRHKRKRRTEAIRKAVQSDDRR